MLALLTTAAAQTNHRPLPVSEREKPDREKRADVLPITRVALYKNGVGFFEHAGRVTGDQSVTIDFTSAQLNDVLQSLTAIDLNGGRISGAGYNSTTPLEQQLKTLPLALNGDPTDVDFYNAIRGARVQVTGAGAAITGRLLSIDLRELAPKNEPGADSPARAEPAQSHRFVTVVSDGGQVRTLELTGGVSVTLLDTALHTDVTRYLELLASTRNQGLRHLTLLDRGPGARELHVSYISEVPVWKSTYRILFTGAASSATLQGWSVVDNTTGSDWNNVHLDLIAGAPQSFIQPLSTPYYTRRPEIPLPEEAQLAPQTHESGELTGQSGVGVLGTVTDATGATIPNAQVTVTNVADAAAVSASTGPDGRFQVGLQQAGQYEVHVTAPGFNTHIQRVNVDGQQMVGLNVQLGVGSSSQTVEVSGQQIESLSMYKKLKGATRSARTTNGVLGGMMGASAGAIGGPVVTDGPAPPISGEAYQQMALQSLKPGTTTSAFDDYFQYSLTDPITIRKNESALVPILQTKLPVERVTLWSAQEPVALRALWITNSSDLTLDRGSFAIVENGSFGGEGLLDPIHPGEKRLLSYAADQAVRVTVDHQNDTRTVRHLTIRKGVLTETSAEIAEVEYLVHNAAPEARTVIVEQAVRQGWTLDSEPKPAETTAAAYRFRVETKPRKSVRLHVGERHTNFEFIRLVDRTEEQLRLLITNAKASPAVLAALQPVFDAHNAVVALDEQIRAREAEMAEIGKDQERLRENMKALKGSAEERALIQRYTGEMNGQEDRLAALRTQVAQLHTQRTAADADFQAKLDAVNVDETI